MKIITLWQPWASFISKGWKTIETRLHNRFKNLVGETIGIHAAQKWDKDWLNLAREFMTLEQLDKVNSIFKISGVIICTAYVTEVRELTAWDSANALIDCANTKRYGLVLEKIKILKSAIPAKGKQGIWNYDQEGINNETAL